MFPLICSLQFEDDFKNLREAGFFQSGTVLWKGASNLFYRPFTLVNFRDFSDFKESDESNPCIKANT